MYFCTCKKSKTLYKLNNWIQFDLILVKFWFHTFFLFISNQFYTVDWNNYCFAVESKDILLEVLHYSNYRVVNLTNDGFINRVFWSFLGFFRGLPGKLCPRPSRNSILGVWLITIQNVVILPVLIRNSCSRHLAPEAQFRWSDVHMLATFTWGVRPQFSNQYLRFQGHNQFYKSIINLYIDKINWIKIVQCQNHRTKYIINLQKQKLIL